MLEAALRTLSEDGRGRSCNGYEGVEWRLFRRRGGPGPNRTDVSAAHLGQLALSGEGGILERHRELVGDAIVRTPHGVIMQQLLLMIDGAAAVSLRYLVSLREAR